LIVDVSLEAVMVREDDRAKFKELAEKRVNRAIKDLALVGNLANRSNYSYTEQDAKKILKVLKDALDETRSKFESGGASAKNEFRLD
jgi:hypothetical protein